MADRLLYVWLDFWVVFVRMKFNALFYLIIGKTIAMHANEQMSGASVE
jgi:hypothetical protein